MKPELIDLETVPPHMRQDYARRNRNVALGRPLCDHCGGTGNELLSMYGRCPKCDGTGDGSAK